MNYFDSHAHTTLSYCASAEMTPELYRQALDSPHSQVYLQGITNHGFQAYFPPETAWSWAFLDNPHIFEQYRERGDERLLALKEELEALDERLVFGVETELMCNGRLTISEEVRKQTRLLIGSLHVFPEAYIHYSGKRDFFNGFIRYTKDLAASGIDVLAHPFRCLAGETDFIPHEIVTEVIHIAKTNNVAVELNARGRTISRLMLVREVAKADAVLSLATDAHTIAEVGDLAPHIDYIKRAGYSPEELHLFSMDP